MLTGTPKVNVALVGGGPGSFIIPSAHMRGLMMDNAFNVVAGAFSSDPAKSKASAANYRIDDSRAYDTWQKMLLEEKQREDGAKLVVIGTPNHLHVPVAKMAWELGYHVVTDKPLSNCIESAQELYDLVTANPNSGQVFAITHNYMRNAMAVMAAEMVRNGDIGEVQFVSANYFQGWLATSLENEGQKQASWRTNQELAGAGAFGDIGVHAFMQAIMMGNLVPDEISADLDTLVEGREVDDHGHAIIYNANYAKIVLQVSQVLQGHVNNHWVEVSGSKGSLRWHQESPDFLEVRRNGSPLMVYQRNACNMTPVAGTLCRVPGGHPEAYLEGFANIYSQVANQINLINEGRELPTDPLMLAPTIADGLKGNIFIDLAQRSSDQGGEYLFFENEVFQI